MSEYQASLLRQLEAMKRCFGPGAARQCERVLRKLSGVRYPGVQSLIAAHDNLLFLRAFPQSEMVARLADSLLSALEPQMERLASSEGNAAALDDESVSGMAGTTVANVLTYDLAKQLTARHGSALTANWNVDECYRQMGLTLPSALPLLEDDSYVEADTPYLKWIEAASSASTSELMWLLENLGKLEVSPVERAALYAGLQVEVEWKLRRSPASRTLARGKVSNLYCHEEPLLQRQQVSLDDEMAATPLPVQRLSRREAREVFNLVQDALTVRYRELQGTTYGDDKTVLKADPGRGLQLFLWGLQADWRLPLRAYYAGIALKNGVPINYFEAIGLFEWMEVGFNTFYAYREGETAWIYAQYLRLLNQISGASCISVYPYQIGKENEEAIKSGAFWFYRKLGFRPGRPELLALTERQEAKMARNQNHRTSPQTLRRLADGHIFFEFGGGPRGQWDTFSTRTIGLHIQQKMADEFGGDAKKMRSSARHALENMLRVEVAGWNDRERWAFDNFSLVLSLAREMKDWSAAEKQSLTRVIKAKAGADETKFLRLMQKHNTLRRALLVVGSTSRAE